jgi:hypothetical protein
VASFQSPKDCFICPYDFKDILNTSLKTRQNHELEKPDFSKYSSKYRRFQLPASQSSRTKSSSLEYETLTIDIRAFGFHVLVDFVNESAIRESAFLGYLSFSQSFERGTDFYVFLESHWLRSVFVTT